MIKTVYVTVEALIKLFNEDYGMRLPKNTRFILTSEINKEKEQSYIADLQSQLAEKEKEIEELKAQRRIYLNRSVEECNKITDLEFELQHKDQDKISLAIGQLEKVKEWCENHKFSDEYDYIIAYEEDEEDASGCEDYFKDYIDNQIKAIKGEK